MYNSSYLFISIKFGNYQAEGFKDKLTKNTQYKDRQVQNNMPPLFQGKLKLKATSLALNSNF